MSMGVKQEKTGKSVIIDQKFQLLYYQYKYQLRFFLLCKMLWAVTLHLAE